MDYIGSALAGSSSFLPSGVTEIFSQGRDHALARIPGLAGMRSVVALATLVGVLGRWGRWGQWWDDGGFLPSEATEIYAQGQDPTYCLLPDSRA